MPIDLIPTDNEETLVGETVSPEAPPEEPAVVEPTEVAVETPPVKRGRGRPPGSRNKPKEAPPAEAPVEHRPRAPRAPIATPPVEPPPPPKPVERRPRAPRKREYVAPESPPESPPETPRAYRARVQREYREIRVSQHAERRDHFSSLLNRFMH